MKRAYAQKTQAVLGCVAILSLLAIDARAFGNSGLRAAPHRPGRIAQPACESCKLCRATPTDEPCSHSPASRSGMQQQPLPHAQISSVAGRFVLGQSSDERGLGGMAATARFSPLRDSQLRLRLGDVSQRVDAPRHPAIGLTLYCIAPPIS